MVVTPTITSGINPNLSRIQPGQIAIRNSGINPNLVQRVTQPPQIAPTPAAAQSAQGAAALSPREEETVVTIQPSAQDIQKQKDYDRQVAVFNKFDQMVDDIKAGKGSYVDARVYATQHRDDLKAIVTDQEALNSLVKSLYTIPVHAAMAETALSKIDLALKNNDFTKAQSIVEDNRDILDENVGKSQINTFVNQLNQAQKTSEVNKVIQQGTKGVTTSPLSGFKISALPENSGFPIILTTKNPIKTAETPFPSPAEQLRQNLLKQPVYTKEGFYGAALSLRQGVEDIPAALGNIINPPQPEKTVAAIEKDINVYQKDLNSYNNLLKAYNKRLDALPDEPSVSDIRSLQQTKATLDTKKDALDTQNDKITKKQSAFETEQARQAEINPVGKAEEAYSQFLGLRLLPSGEGFGDWLQKRVEAANPPVVKSRDIIDTSGIVNAERRFVIDTAGLSGNVLEGGYKFLRNKPLEAAGTYMVGSVGFPLLERAGAGLIAKTATTTLPGVSRVLNPIGRMASSPTGGMFVNVGKVGLLGTYVVGEGTNILSKPTRAEQAQAAGEALTGFGLLTFGAMNPVKFKPVKNPFLGREFFSGEIAPSPAGKIAKFLPKYKIAIGDAEIAPSSGESPVINAKYKTIGINRIYGNEGQIVRNVLNLGGIKETNSGKSLFFGTPKPLPEEFRFAVDRFGNRPTFVAKTPLETRIVSRLVGKNTPLIERGLDVRTRTTESGLNLGQIKPTIKSVIETNNVPNPGKVTDAITSDLLDYKAFMYGSTVQRGVGIEQGTPSLGRLANDLDMRLPMNKDGSSQINDFAKDVVKSINKAAGKKAATLDITHDPKTGEDKYTVKLGKSKLFDIHNEKPTKAELLEQGTNPSALARSQESGGSFFGLGMKVERPVMTEEGVPVISYSEQVGRKLTGSLEYTPFERTVVGKPARMEPGVETKPITETSGGKRVLTRQSIPLPKAVYPAEKVPAGLVSDWSGKPIPTDVKISKTFHHTNYPEKGVHLTPKEHTLWHEIDTGIVPKTAKNIGFYERYKITNARSVIVSTKVSESIASVTGKLVPRFEGRMKDIGDYYFGEKANIVTMQKSPNPLVRRSASIADKKLESWLDVWGKDMAKNVRTNYQARIGTGEPVSFDFARIQTKITPEVPTTIDKIVAISPFLAPFTNPATITTAPILSAFNPQPINNQPLSRANLDPSQRKMLYDRINSDQPINAIISTPRPVTRKINLIQKSRRALSSGGSEIGVINMQAFKNIISDQSRAISSKQSVKPQSKLSSLSPTSKINSMSVSPSLTSFSPKSSTVSKSPSTTVSKSISPSPYTSPVLSGLPSTNTLKSPNSKSPIPSKSPSLSPPPLKSPSPSLTPSKSPPPPSPVTSRSPFPSPTPSESPVPPKSPSPFTFPPSESKFLFDRKKKKGKKRITEFVPVTMPFENINLGKMRKSIWENPKEAIGISHRKPTIPKKSKSKSAAKTPKNIKRFKISKKQIKAQKKKG